MTEKTGVFQVVEKQELSEEGTLQKSVEVLQEGDIIERGGVRYLVVKNEKGTLYKQSINPLGQVGNIQPVSITEYQEQSLTAIKEHFGTPDMGASLLETLAALKAPRPDLSVEDFSLQVANIQPLYLDLFSELAAKAMQRKVKKVVEQEVRDNEMKVNVAMFLTVVISKRQGREEAIAELVEAVNIMAEKGWVRGTLAPLSSMAISVPDTGREFRNFLERVSAPPLRYDEAIFVFPLIKSEHMKEAMAMFPKIAMREGEIPPPYGPPAAQGVCRVCGDHEGGDCA